MLSFFPRDDLDEIWDLIESVSEGFPIYKYGVIKVVSFCRSGEKLSLRHNESPDQSCTLRQDIHTLPIQEFNLVEIKVYHVPLLQWETIFMTSCSLSEIGSTHIRYHSLCSSSNSIVFFKTPFSLGINSQSSRFFPSRMNLLLEGISCAGKQTRSRKSHFLL